MKVLVTGSSGHLGEALVLTLLERGLGVLGLDIKQSYFATGRFQGLPRPGF